MFLLYLCKSNEYSIYRNPLLFLSKHPHQVWKKNKDFKRQEKEFIYWAKLRIKISSSWEERKNGKKDDVGKNWKEKTKKSENLLIVNHILIKKGLKMGERGRWRETTANRKSIAKAIISTTFCLFFQYKNHFVILFIMVNLWLSLNGLGGPDFL